MYESARKPFLQRHPIISILTSILVTSVIFAIQSWLWSFLIPMPSLWILVLSLIGTVLIVYLVIKKAKKGILRSLFVFEIDSIDSSDVEYPTVDQEKNVSKKINTPAPDTMTENAIKKVIRKSKRIQAFLKRRKDQDDQRDLQ